MNIDELSGKENPRSLCFSRFPGQAAHLAGFEPTAFRLGGGCSILLSYRCRNGSII